jgi:hypothetical protein
MSYVYRHIRLDTNEVFYIGVGSDDNYRRAHDTTQRNEFWKRIAEKTPHEVDILFDDIVRDEALEKEKEFIALYGRRNINAGTLVNLTDGGEKGPNGWQPTEEQRAKMREASAQRNLTPELRAKFATGKNRIKSAEERAKLSAAHKGKIFTPEHREKLANYRRGRKASEETRAKQSAARKRRVYTPELRANISAALKGKQRTEEHSRNNAISNYRLTAEQVNEIRRLGSLGISCTKIATQFGCSGSAIHLILKGKSYKHINTLQHG